MPEREPIRSFTDHHLQCHVVDRNLLGLCDQKLADREFMYRPPRKQATRREVPKPSPPRFRSFSGCRDEQLVLQPHTWKKVGWAQSRARYANMIIGHIDRARFHAL